MIASPRQDGAPSGAAPKRAFSQRGSDAVDHLRSTAKWIVTIFGALGAALTAGLQLTGLGRLEWSGARFAWAALAIVVALVAIGWIVWSAVRVLTTGEEVLFAELEAQEVEWSKKGKPPVGFPDMTYIERAGLLGPPLPTIQHLRFEWSEIQDRYNRAADDTAKERVRVRYESYWQRKENLATGVRYARVRREFDRTTRAMFAGGALAASAIVVFAWAANPPSPRAEAGPFRTPVEARLHLTVVGAAALAPVLGADCVSAPVPVVVLRVAESPPTGAEVVSIPRDGCRTARLNVDPGVGTLAPALAVAIPGASPESSPAAQATPAPNEPGLVAGLGGQILVVDPAKGPVLGIAADAAVAATVGGDVLLVGGDLDLRPGAHVGGDVHLVGGELMCDGVPAQEVNGKPTCGTGTGMVVDGAVEEGIGGSLLRRVSEWLRPFWVAVTLGEFVVVALVGLVLKSRVGPIRAQLKAGCERLAKSETYVAPVGWVVVAALAALAGLFLPVVGPPVAGVFGVVLFALWFLGHAVIGLAFAARIMAGKRDLWFFVVVALGLFVFLGVELLVPIGGSLIGVLAGLLGTGIVGFLTLKAERNARKSPAPAPDVPPPPPPVGSLADGSLVHLDGDTHRYVVYGGGKFRIPSAQSLKDLGLNDRESAAINRDAFSAIPTNWARNGTLLKEPGKWEEYIVVEGAPLWIPKREHFDAMGLQEAAVRLIPDGTIAQMHQVPADEVLLRHYGTEAVYRFKGGKRRKHPKPVADREGKIDGEPVIDVPYGTLDGIEEGPPLEPPNPPAANPAPPTVKTG